MAALLAACAGLLHADDASAQANALPYGQNANNANPLLSGIGGAQSKIRPSQGIFTTNRLGSAFSNFSQPPPGTSPSNYTRPSPGASQQAGTSQNLAAYLSPTSPFLSKKWNRPSQVPTGGGIALRGLDLRGSRASEVLSQPLYGRFPGLATSELARRASQTAGINTRLSRMKAADRFGLAFANGPINWTPTLPSAPPVIGQSTSLSPAPRDIQPVAEGPVDVAARTRRDSAFYLERAVERFFLAEQPSLARLDFDKVRLLDPGHPAAFFGSCLAAMRLSDIQQALVLWKQGLTRFDETSGTLSDLNFDFSPFAVDPARLQTLKDNSVRIYREIRKEIQHEGIPKEAAPRVISLAAYLAWLSGDPAVALEEAHTAAELDRRLDPDRRVAGIGLLYQRLKEASPAPPTPSGRP